VSKITIGFSTAKTRNPFSWLIRRVEGTPYSHCYIKYYSQKYDLWLVYHASHTSIHFMSYDRFLLKSKIIKEYELEISTEARDNLIKNGIKKAGIPYGALEILGMLTARLMRLWFNLKIKNFLADNQKTQVCSELLYYDLKEFVDFGDFNPELDGPKKIEKAISQVAVLTFPISQG